MELLTDEREGIGIVLLDEHLLFRESLAGLLAAEKGFTIVGQCANSTEALKLLKTSGVDVVLVDLRIAEEFIQCAHKGRYNGKFLVVARTLEVPGSAAVLRSGASGIFLESDSSTRLIQAIRQVAHGEAWLDQRVIQLLADRYPQYTVGNFTEREESVLHAVVDGLSNRKIGEQIGVSESCVKATLQQLFTKAGVRTRSQLVRIALEGSYLAKSPAKK
jgi:two-component system, NarL family, nitrate/nitrite response regulator NarL